MSKKIRNEMLNNLYNRYPNLSEISKKALQNLIDIKTNIGDYIIEDEYELKQLTFYIENDCKTMASKCL